MFVVISKISLYGPYESKVTKTVAVSVIFLRLNNYRPKVTITDIGLISEHYIPNVVITELYMIITNKN